MRRPVLLSLAALMVASALVPSAASAQRSSIRVGIGDQNPAMFDDPNFQRLNLKRTRYFVRWNVMEDRERRLAARAFMKKAKEEDVSVLLHISTDDFTERQAERPSTARYRREMTRLVRYFRTLGVRDFGTWNEANHKTQPTWDSPGHAAQYFKDLYRIVKGRCNSCAVVALDVLDQAGVERYIRSFYSRLSPTWRRRASVVGIHNYSDVNRNRSRGTSSILRTVRRYNGRTKFWFTETGALASFGRSFRFDEERQASRLRNMFTYASRYRRSGVDRVYSYNWFGVAQPDCGTTCGFDAGLVRADGSTRPAYDVFRQRVRSYSR